MNRDQIEELAEVVHESSDGEDMIGIIEDWLASKNDEDYQKLLEVYNLA